MNLNNNIISKIKQKENAKIILNTSFLFFYFMCMCFFCLQFICTYTHSHTYTLLFEKKLHDEEYTYSF